jgi:hypothetical protein
MEILEILSRIANSGSKTIYLHWDRHNGTHFSYAGRIIPTSKMERMAWDGFIEIKDDWRSRMKYVCKVRGTALKQYDYVITESGKEAARKWNLRKKERRKQAKRAAWEHWRESQITQEMQPCQ